MHCSAALALSVPHNVPTPMLCPNVSKSAKPQKSCNEMISVADMGGGDCRIVQRRRWRRRRRVGTQRRMRKLRGVQIASVTVLHGGVGALGGDTTEGSTLGLLPIRCVGTDDRVLHRSAGPWTPGGPEQATALFLPVPVLLDYYFPTSGLFFVLAACSFLTKKCYRKTVRQKVLQKNIA